MRLEPRLPGTGTTIFTVMSRLAEEVGAINLSQGFPDFPVDEGLARAVGAAIAEGHNQYAPMPGSPVLREAIAAKLLRTPGVACDPETEITVTAGATQALFTAVGALIRPGDEAIVLDPAYDSYAPAVRLFGGVPVHVPLSARGHFDEGVAAAVERARTPRTRILFLNSPHNPSGRIQRAPDLDRIAALLDGTPIVLLSDEVYEHLVFDGATHASALAHPALRPRTLAVYSFGKVFHATGWKLGYAVAPAELTAAFRSVHQFNVFSVNHPMQRAVAGHLENPGHWDSLAAFFQKKRDRFRRALEGSRFHLLPCEGSYFQLADYSAIRDIPDRDFAEWVAREHGVASIPLSPFHAHPDPDARIIRFCFAKRESTLDAAAERLCRI